MEKGKVITLELYGNPVPQSRPRVYRSGNKSRAYDEKAKLKEGCKWQLKSQYRETPIGAPLALDIIYFMPIPKGTSKIQQKQMINGLRAHVKRPDIDNLLKFTLDCLNGLLFEDDSQVCDIRAKKIFSSSPGTLIRAMPLANDKRDLLYENCAR